MLQPFEDKMDGQGMAEIGFEDVYKGCHTPDNRPNRNCPAGTAEPVSPDTA
jgi:hypothetical protein